MLDFIEPPTLIAMSGFCAGVALMVFFFCLAAIGGGK